MRKVFRLLVIVFDALLGIAEPKTSKKYINIDEAQTLFDAELISIREYNRAIKRK